MKLGRRPLVAGVLLLTACGGASVPRPLSPSARGERPSPLGSSWTLSPLPGDDDSLLGRVVDAVPGEGQSLDEVARPNPCADKLTPSRTLPSVATFEDAEELSFGAKGSAALGMFGFSGDAARATHFVYKLETDKRITSVDTAEYEACCRAKKGCGYGFVSALVYGTGEYATAEETSGSGGVSVAFAKAEGTAALKILHRRAVRGWVAAMIRVTDKDRAPADGMGTLGDPSALGVTLDESRLPDQVKGRFEAGRVRVEDAGRDQRPESNYVYKDAVGVTRTRSSPATGRSWERARRARGHAQQNAEIVWARSLSSLPAFAADPTVVGIQQGEDTTGTSWAGPPRLRDRRARHGAPVGSPRAETTRTITASPSSTRSSTSIATTACCCASRCATRPIACARCKGAPTRRCPSRPSGSRAPSERGLLARAPRIEFGRRRTGTYTSAMLGPRVLVPLATLALGTWLGLGKPDAPIVQR